MTTAEIRREIKKAVDQLPLERLASLADYVQFLARHSLEQRLAAGKKAVAEGRVVNWRKVRKDV